MTANFDSIGAVDAAANGMRLLALDEEMTIYRAAEIRLVLLAALEQGTPLALDLSPVAEIDTSGVQLLLAARRHAAVSGVPLALCGYSAAVEEAFGLLGLTLEAGGGAAYPAGRKGQAT
jgi:anti-sigma B factor antagonist